MGAVKTTSTGFTKNLLSDYHAYGTQRHAQSNQRLPRGSWEVLESKYTVANSSVGRFMCAIGWLDKELKAIICSLKLYKTVSDVVIERLSETENILLKVFIYTFLALKHLPIYSQRSLPSMFMTIFAKEYSVWNVTG